MSKILLVFLTLAVLTGCPNQLPEEGIPVNSDDSRKITDGPLIVQGDKKIPILAPVGFTEETILVRLTDSADKPVNWSMQDSIKNHLGNDVTNSVGFGQLQNDIGEADTVKYAVSLPWPSKPMWLHVATGTEVDGVFKEGTLIDIFGNEYTVTSLNFYFHRKSGSNANFDAGKKQSILVQSQASSASGQVASVKQGNMTRNPILEYGTDNLQLQFYVEAKVQDENGYERTLTFKVLCGAKFEVVPVPDFYSMFASY